MILLPLSFLYQRDKEAVLLWIERLISLELLLLLFSGVWLKNVFQRNQMNVLIMNGTYLLCKAGSGNEVIINHIILGEKGKAFTHVIKHRHTERRFPVLAFHGQQVVFLFSDPLCKTIKLNGAAEPGILHRVIANRAIVNRQFSLTIPFFQPEQGYIFKGSGCKIPDSLQSFTEKHFPKTILNHVSLVKDEPVPEAKQAVSHRIVVGFLGSDEGFPEESNCTYSARRRRPA